MKDKKENTNKKDITGQLPTVYIVLPLYNGEKYFLEQLMSIYYQNYEKRFLIIVNDGSTDKSGEIAKNFVSNYKLGDKVKIITKENGGVNSAMTRGLEEVKKMTDIYHEKILISYCDQDDIWTREKLAVQVEYMETHSECDISYHDAIGIDKNGILINPSLQRTCYHDNSFFYLSTISSHMWSTEIMFRPKYIDYIIPLPTGPGMYQDYRTILVISLLEGKYEFIDKKLVSYRQHASLSYLDKASNVHAGLSYLINLKERFPEKDLSYVISYCEDMSKKQCLICRYLIMLCKYPKVFFLGLRAVLYKFLRFGRLN